MDKSQRLASITLSHYPVLFSSQSFSLYKILIYLFTCVLTLLSAISPARIVELHLAFHKFSVFWGWVTQNRIIPGALLLQGVNALKNTAVWRLLCPLGDIWFLVLPARSIYCVCICRLGISGSYPSVLSMEVIILISFFSGPSSVIALISLMTVTSWWILISLTISILFCMS